MTSTDRPELRAIAGAIAKAMGATLLPINPDRDHDQWARVATPEGPELSLHFDWQSKRLVTGINLPQIKDRDGNLRQQTTRDLEWNLKRDGHAIPETSITTDSKRAAEAIAKDIKRRLLPGAVLWHQAALARKADAEANTAGIKATITQLCKTLKHHHDERHGDTLYLDKVRMQVSSPDSVRFDSFYVDAATAITIYKILQEAKVD